MCHKNGNTDAHYLKQSGFEGMASITKPDLIEFAKRVRIIANALKGLSRDNAQFPEEVKTLSEELKAVAAH